MRVVWTQSLPDLGEDAPSSHETPLYWDGDSVFVPIRSFEHDRATRAKDPTARGSRIDVHRIQAGRRETLATFQAFDMLIPQHWSFVRFGDELLLHAGPFFSISQRERLAQLPAVDASLGAGRGLFLEHDELVVFADRCSSTLHCFDVACRTNRWSVQLRNTHRYDIGPISLRGSQLVCFGCDALNTLDLASGKIVDQRSFPRIDKLYPPTEYDHDLLYPFTNATSGGLLRFDPTHRKIRWSFRTRGSVAAQRGAGLVVVGRTAILSVNDGSSLVGVDVETGEQRWKYRAQWLYTPLRVVGDSFIFGTAGGYGHHLRRHKAETGDTEWAVAMNGGCPYYSVLGDDLIAGDWKGTLRRVRSTDGQVVAEQELGDPITAEPLIANSTVFVLKWPVKGNAPSLIALEAD